ncbi:GntR family transcriptional regulator [Roseomonas gilardii]|uniref:GntR family transcriptional regulator n=1 Tax=Roseomonas gilardii TaxID=257708 RepID=UPI0011A4ABAE|nr:GntR family transcriptional regulator [Roseomonas gilardii]
MSANRPEPERPEPGTSLPAPEQLSVTSGDHGPQGAPSGVSGRGPGQTHAERLTDHLAGRIVAGALPPGQKLDEQALAKEAGLSRTPVREALNRLAATGLVELRPRRGAVVSCPDPQRLRDGFEFLAEIEALCARWSALRMTPRERTGLDKRHRDMAVLVRTGNTTGYSGANRLWHEMLYRGAHNSQLLDTAIATHRRLSPFRTAQFETTQRLAISHGEHGRVVAAVLQGDAEGAAEAMRQHIRQSGESWERISASAMIVTT